MIKSVTIGDKDIVLVANGATPYRYKQVFSSDLMSELTKVTETEDTGKVIDIVSKLAYIMKSQAEHTDMNTINEESFIGWLEEFEPMDFAIYSKDVIDVYLHNMKTTSVAKKKGK